MRILPVLVLAEYDKDLNKQMYINGQTQSLPSRLYILSPKFYPVEFRMEPADNDGLFITRQHFKTKDDWHKGKKLYVPGFCILDLRPGESEEQYVMKYRVNNVGEYKEMSFFSASDKRLITPSHYPRCGVFFDLPSFHFTEKKGEIVSEYDADTDTAVLGSVNVGYTEIGCFKKDNNDSEIKCYLKVLPSSMTEQVFGRMVDDILAVHRLLLVSKNGKQSLSLNKSWETNLVEISEKLSKIEDCFKLIQKRYYTRLKLMRCSIDKRLIKKFDDKLIMQFALEPSKQKYKAEKLSEDNNIYEHRMILWALNGLSKFINVVSDSVKGRNDIEKKGIQYNKNRFLRRFKFNSLDDADSLIQTLNTCNRGVIFDRLIECSSVTEQESDEKREINKGSVLFQGFSIYDEDLSEIGMPVVLSSCGFEGTNFFLSYTCEYDKEGKGKKDLKLKIISNNAQWQELIYKEFSRIKRKYNKYSSSEDSPRCSLKIVGEYERPDTEEDSFEKRETYIFYSVDAVYIDDRECKPKSTIQEAKEYLKQLDLDKAEYNTNGDIKLKHYHKVEELAFKYLANELEAEKNKYSAVNEETNIDIFEHKDLNKKILELKKYNFLNGLMEYGNETWTLTQKFINDPNYKAVYNIFHDLDENYHFSEIYSSYSLIHQKVNDLYEYWIFIKILEVLMLKQKWELIEVDGKKSEDAFKDISVIVSKILSIQNNTLQSCQLTFSHALGHRRKNAKLLFSYNRDIWFVKRIGKSDHLTPDYHFEIIYETPDKKTVKKHFCLDAKYRNYKEQKGKWTEDINKVCIENYLCKLNESLKQTCTNVSNDEKYVAAFIVHSDINSSPYWGGDFRKSLNIEKINEEGKKYPCHKVGSFPLHPNIFLDDERFKDIERNLLKFFIMVFEYHCGLYDICWECGNVDLKPLDSSLGVSIHFRCDKCNRFWVKNHCGNKPNNHPLIKHKYNYHKESTANTHFLVKCPVCGNEYEN